MGGSFRQLDEPTTKRAVDEKPNDPGLGLQFARRNAGRRKPAVGPKAPAAEKKLLWGDTQLHTSYSFDAFLNNNLSADPDTAYRFANGAPVIHPYHRARMQRRVPLDFLVVSDHAEFIGGLRDIYRNGINDDDAGIWGSIRNWFVTRAIRNAIEEGEGVTLFRDVPPVSGDPREAARNWQEDANASDMQPSPSVMRTA